MFLFFQISTFTLLLCPIKPESLFIQKMQLTIKISLNTADGNQKTNSRNLSALQTDTRFRSLCYHNTAFYLKKREKWTYWKTRKITGNESSIFTEDTPPASLRGSAEEFQITFAIYSSLKDRDRVAFS